MGKVRKLLLRKFKKFFIIFIGWSLLFPIVSFIKRFFPKKYIIFIGRDSSVFLDNCKYLYLYMVKNYKNLNPIFLTEDKDTFISLRRNNLPVIFYPSIEATKVILQSKILIVDNLMWIKNFKHFLFLDTFKIQLWHGAGFKYIEKMNKKDKEVNSLKGFLTGRRQKYDVVVSTSPFYTKYVFSKSFDFNEIWETGYPRNDVFFRNIDKYDLINVDISILDNIQRKKQKGFKIMLYAPTFRDTGGDPFQDKAINLTELNSFLKKQNIFLLMKFHPDPNFDYKKFDNLSNITIYPNEKDIYPIMKFVDVLITDYSSIYMDFILMDKPVIFFPYDYSKYITKDRQIQFDYNWITPGPKAYKFDELIQTIENILENDRYKKQRENIRNIAWKFVDGNASYRIVKNITAVLNKI